MTSPLYPINLTKKRLPLFSFVFFFSLFFCIGFSLLASDGIYSESPVPGLSGASGLSAVSAVTSDPLHLLSGAVTETVFDLSLPTPLVQSWSHKRTYSSDMSTGVADKELIGLQGHCWLGGNQSHVLLKKGNKITFVQSASNKRTFIETNGTFTAPSDFDATLVKRGTDESEEYVLTRNDSKEVFIYYGFASTVSVSLRGKLKERTNLQYQAQALTGELYSYDERGLVTEITTASPQLYCIKYTYDTDGITSDKLTKIEIFTGIPDSGDSLKIAEADYTYFESLSNPPSDLGSFGDLVQVKISTLTSDQVTWQTRVTQYRYYHSSSADGVSHQLKAVFEPDAVERILTGNNNISSSDDILQQPDSATLASGNSVSSYSSRIFTYYTENIDTNSSIVTSWGTENLATQYGGTNQNELKQLVDGSGNPVLGSFIPRVKTETINAGCFSCGGSSGGGLRKTYFYMGLNPAPSDYSGGIPNVVTYLVVEDTVDSANTPVQRTIYGLDYRGVELRRVDIENPTNATLNTVCTSKTYNNKGKILEQRSSPVHSSVNSNALVTQFLNPVNPSDLTWTNDLATMASSQGLIHVFEYDTDGNRISTKLKVGSSGTAYFVSASDFQSNNQEIVRYIYPTQTTNRAASDRVTTTYAYTYWDTAQKVIKTKTTTQQAVPASQNGSGVSPVTNEYNDESGRLRWIRDALGVVTYYGYQPENGLQHVIVKDVNTSSLPQEILNTWTGTVPFPREAALPTALNQTARYEYDEQGRLTTHINAAGVANYLLYGNHRLLRFSAWDAAAQQPLLPIEVRETNAVGKTLDSYQLPPTVAVTADNGQPTGVSTNAAKVAWTRYSYNSGGLLQHVDRYHVIPASGAGTLGTNFYRTTSIYDTQGREAATAQFVQTGKWQVNYNIYDWRNRVTEQQRGVAMNTPVLADLTDTTWLKTVSKTIYNGEQIDKTLSFFDTGTNDYTGTKYYYDAWNRIRSTPSFAVISGTETLLAPFTVQDYDWCDNIVDVAQFEMEPTWSNVVTTPNFAANTTGKFSHTRNSYDIQGQLWKTEEYNNVSNSFDATTYKYDLAGRKISTIDDNTTTETIYDTLSQTIETKTLSGTVVKSIQRQEYNISGKVITQESLVLNPNETTSINESGTNFVRQTVYLWYDNAGRKIVSADFGSGATLWTNAAKPARPNTAPSNSSADCIVTKYSYSPITGHLNTITDPKGIVTDIVYDALGRITKTLENPVSGGTASDENVEVQYSHNGLDNEMTIIAVNSTTGNQVTKYLYEDSYNASLQTSAIYPDSSDTNSNGTDQVKTTYYLDGNIKTQTNQNGSVRTFLYDAHRRPIADSVTTLGNEVDGTIRKIARNYTTRGALEKVSSIDSQNAVLNEVKFEYDSNLQLKKLYQSYSGSVTTSTPYLEYSYDSAHNNRLTGVVYPHGKAINYGYNNFDNVSSINEGTTPLVSYLYDGSGSPMQTAYNEPNVSLTYANGGLDRYGRVVNHSWVKNNNALVHIVHGYDYAGNRLYRNDLVQSVNSELYSYDSLGQIKTLNRGTLNANQTSVTAVNHSEAWNFDKTGNWSQYTKNGTTENRNHNTANELQGIATHDANGNMVLMPGLKGKYDAWNRLVEVRDSNDNLIAQYEYNGLNQRIKKTVGSTITKSFFNENWQEIESQTGSEVTSYIWGLRCIDDLVLREKGEERLYSLADPNWNVVAICDDSGDIQERYTYDAFGKRNVFEEDFTEKTETEFDWNRAFTGQVLDSETGLMLYRERYYDTKFGRFVNRDPIEYWADDMNIYRYVSNNPLSYIDLFGFVKNPKGSGNSPKCDWLDGKPIDELEKMLKDENISKKAKDDIRAHIKTEKRNPKHNTTDGKRKTTKPNTTKPPQSPKPPIKPGPIFRFPFPIIIIPAMDPKWAEKYGA